MYKEKGEEEEDRPRQSVRMLRNAKKREKRRVKAKRDAERPGKKEEARRLRQQARRQRQHARQVRKRARQARKKEETPLGPQKKVKTTKDERRGKLVNQEVKKILMRAPLHASERPKNSCEVKAEKIKRGSSSGWKAGMRQAAAEPAPARRSKTLSTSQVLKLLKKAMNLAAKKVGSNASKTDMASPEVEKAAAPSHARQQTASPSDESDQGGQTSPAEDFKNIKLHSKTTEDRGANEHGVNLKDIGPDFSADIPDLSKNAKVGSKRIVGLAPDNSDGEEEEGLTDSSDDEEKATDSSPPEKHHQEQQPATVVSEPEQEGEVLPEENSNFEEQDARLPPEAEKAKLRRRRRRESAARRIGGDDSEDDHVHLQPPYHLRLKAKINAKRVRKDQPNLTDDSEDDEDQGRTSNQQLQPPHHLLVKAKVNAKRVVRDCPDLTQTFPILTDSSGDEGESKRESKVKVVKELTGDFRGGGAGGSNYYTWLELAQCIMVGVRNAQLPLRLPMNDITEGDGNCYFRAVCSQCQRPEVAAPDHIRRLDHRAMRKKICSFMLKSQLPVVLDFRRRWGEFGLGNYEQYWTDMAESRGDIWAEGPVIHATAWCLERHVYVVSEKATMTDPFLSFSGNQDGTDGSCAGAPLWLGHLTGLHYQTLTLDKKEVLPPPPKMQTIEDTLQSKARATVKGGDKQTSQPGTSRNSSEIEVSAIHSNSNSSSSSILIVAVDILLCFHILTATSLRHHQLRSTGSKQQT